MERATSESCGTGHAHYEASCEIRKVRQACLMQEVRQVRQATLLDLDAIMLIEKACFAEGIQEKESVFKERLELFPKGFFVLTESDSSIIGYYCAELWKSEPQLTHEAFALGHSIQERHAENGTVLYISSFAVLQKSRGGAGRLLFKCATTQIVKSYPQVSTIIFIVNETWSAARHIYETEGFEYVGKLEGFFEESVPGATVSAEAAPATAKAPAAESAPEKLARTTRTAGLIMKKTLQ